MSERKPALTFLILFLLGAAGTPVADRALQAPRAAGAAQLAGRVTDGAGAGLPGVFVTARLSGRPVAVTAVTDATGRYELPGLPAGEHRLTAHAPGWIPAEASVNAGRGAGETMFTLERGGAVLGDVASASFLGLLPDGEDKRRFILDCTGCHLFDERVALPDGLPRSRDSWVEAVGRMLQFAGANSGFPVIGAERDPGATADFLTRHIQAGRGAPVLPAPAPADPATAGSVITEYDIPVPTDLPHDLAILPDGRIAITGMFTHRMYVLDPDAGAFDTIPIPVGNANPRAVEIDDNGDWWVLLGSPQAVARYRPAARAWDRWPIGMYPHSIGIGRGRVWFNGHFTRDPELIGSLDTATGAVERFQAPTHPRAAITGPIPYELRVAPDGRVWVSELAGNRILAFDAPSAAFRVFDMPASHSGPRRLDIARDGSVWIPEYAGNRLTRLDPASGRFESFDLPVPDAAPYVVRVDLRTGIVWIGTGAADAILAFEPASRRFTTFRLPTRGAMVRHMAVDPRNGDVWAAYGASPGTATKVGRLRRG